MIGPTRVHRAWTLLPTLQLPHIACSPHIPPPYIAPSLHRSGFFNDSAFFRYAPGLLVEWGVSGNASLNAEYAHTPIPGDPTGVKSNLRGTVSFADGGMGRASVIFINFGNNSHLDTHIVPFATVAGKESMKTAEDIFDPTPDSANGVPPKAYADNGNAWIRKTYPGINFITGVTLSE